MKSLVEIALLRRAEEQVAEVTRGPMANTGRDRSPYETRGEKWDLELPKVFCRWCGYYIRIADKKVKPLSLCPKCDCYQTECVTCGGQIKRNALNRRDVPIECGDCRDW